LQKALHCQGEQNTAHSALKMETERRSSAQRWREYGFRDLKIFIRAAGAVMTLRAETEMS